MVARLLQQRARTLALAETNTAGALAHRLREAAAGADVLKAAWRVDDPALPQTVRAALPDGSGTVDEAQASAAAEALRRSTGSDMALVVLGTQGENEGVYGAASGRTWLALATPDGVKSELCPFGGRDEYTIVRIGNQALGMLWKQLTR